MIFCIVVLFCVFFFFFFSSRRRHTRCSRDWSSDVCSSDLGHVTDALAFASRAWRRPLTVSEKASLRAFYRKSRAVNQRSEERRVGKECRSRWSPDHEKKKTGE